MALSEKQLNAVTTEYWENRSTDIFFTENVLLYKLLGSNQMDLHMVQPHDMVDGGTKIAEFVEYTNSNTGSYGSTTTINAAKKDIMNRALFRWAGYYASNTIDLEEKRANSGKGMLIDLVAAKMKNIEKTIRDNMGSEIYGSASDSDSFLGLGNLFNTTTSTKYGNIAEDDIAQWAANSTNAAAAMSYKVMQALFRTAQVGQSRDSLPNLVVTTNALADGYERVLQVQQRFSDAKLVEAGFNNVLHKGAPVVGDDNQTSGVVDALNLRYLRIRTHKDYAFTTPVWEKDRLEPDTLTANTRWSGQLICSHRNAQGRYTGVTEPA